MRIQTLLMELGILAPRAARLWCDNIGAKYLSAIQFFMLEQSILKLTITLLEKG
jgi:hypothetical protein